MLSGNSLDRNLEKMYALLESAVLQAKFDDRQRIKTLILGVGFLFGVLACVLACVLDESPLFLQYLLTYRGISPIDVDFLRYDELAGSRWSPLRAPIRLVQVDGCQCKEGVIQGWCVGCLILPFFFATPTTEPPRSVWRYHAGGLCEPVGGSARSYRGDGRFPGRCLSMWGGGWGGGGWGYAGSSSLTHSISNHTVQYHTCSASPSTSSRTPSSAWP